MATQEGSVTPWLMVLFLAGGVLGGVLMVVGVLLVCKFCFNSQSHSQNGRKHSGTYAYGSSAAIPQELDSFSCSETPSWMDCSTMEPYQRGQSLIEEEECGLTDSPREERKAEEAELQGPQREPPSAVDLVGGVGNSALFESFSNQQEADDRESSQ